MLWPVLSVVLVFRTFVFRGIQNMVEIFNFEMHGWVLCDSFLLLTILIELISAISA